MITREEYPQAAQQFGTPLFVYDADQITSQYKRLVEAFSVPTLKLQIWKF